jgi:hypothetical protein
LRSAVITLIIVGAMAIGHDRKTEQSQATPQKASALLLPGYHYTASSGFDSSAGRIWKDDGPIIGYEFDLFGGARARGYAEQNPKRSLTVTGSPATGEFIVALDQNEDRMVVDVDGRAYFDARNVRTRKDVVEVLQMATALARALKPAAPVKPKK